MAAGGQLIKIVLAWALLITIVGAAAYLVVGPAIRPRGRNAGPADLARGEALIRRQYSSARTRVGRVSLQPAGLCAMRGSVELIDDGVPRQAACLVFIRGWNDLSADCR